MDCFIDAFSVFDRLEASSRFYREDMGMMKLDPNKWYWQRIFTWSLTGLVIAGILALAIWGWTIRPWNWKGFALIGADLIVFFFHFALDRDEQRDFEKYHGPGKWPGT